MGYRFSYALDLLVAQHGIAAKARFAVQYDPVLQAHGQFPLRILIHCGPAPLDMHFRADTSALIRQAVARQRRPPPPDLTILNDLDRVPKVGTLRADTDLPLTAVGLSAQHCFVNVKRYRHLVAGDGIGASVLQGVPDGVAREFGSIDRQPTVAV